MKPALAKGTRDFSPEVTTKREHIIRIIKDAFVRYGFAPIETPAFERSETLLGKYGNEGDRLIFKILNSGDFLNKVPDDYWKEKKSNRWAAVLSEKALRYDLTVPFARYVVMHRNELRLPFKRYQIQPVWRADRPQKGRYREFYQCDADVVGSDSLWQDVEFVLLYDEVFDNLKIPSVKIKINNRKILAGIVEVTGNSDKLTEITVALDKLDKVGADGVKKELLAQNISQDSVDKLSPLMEMKGDNSHKLSALSKMLAHSDTGTRGVEELSFVMDKIEKTGLKSAVLELDVSLARGLNYYTGTILEVVTGALQIGSIGGGGRYDDLTGIFGWKGLSGIGISFGLDRIFLVMEKIGGFEDLKPPVPKVMFINFGDKESLYALKTLQLLRKDNISSILYPDSVKMNKQMKYADQSGIRYVVLAGTEEISQEVFTVKDMKTGEQQRLDYRGIKALFSK